MDEPPDFYAQLGVKPDATPGEIRRAYRDRARQVHPDLVGDRGLIVMRQLNAAWDILRHPARRAAYDLARRGSDAAAGSGLRRGGGTATGIGGREARADEPKWTGAAGPPPGRPAGSRLDFGLYAGWTLGEIARHDNGYLLWLADRREGKPYAEEIKVLMEHQKPKTELPKKGFFRR